LASGFSPVYPCHVSPRDMRQRPIGTGPFKFVEFKPNESIKLVRNPDYWKPGRPYLDGLEYTISRNVSTAILSFVSGKFTITKGEGTIGAVIQTPRKRILGKWQDVKHTVTSCELGVAQNSTQAREIMRKLGYGTDKHLAIKVTIPQRPFFRDTAVIIIVQMK